MASVRGSRRWLPLALLLLAGFTPVAAAQAPPPCGGGSWIAGTVDLCEGVLVYRDLVLDDYGAAGGGAHYWNGGLLSIPRGGARYETQEDVDGRNKYADLVALRIWVEGDQLHVSFELNALFETSQTFGALAIDTDDDPTTGGGVWGSLIASLVSGGPPVPLRSSGWEILHVFEEGDSATTAIDLEANTISGAIPLPPGERWRLQAVTGRRAANNVFNVAFRSGESGFWFEALQAQALSAAGGGDISAFGLGVDVADLLGGATRRADPGPGFYQRVYVSDYTLALDPDTGVLVYDTEAEGYAYGTSGNNTYGLPGRRAAAGSLGQWFSALGRYQPYGIYLPAAEGPHGVQLVMHGLSATHSSQVDQPGMQQRFGEELNRILVAPLGRGPLGFYSDISERDVLDALADVLAVYDVDTDRVFAGGYSMGGYGAYYFASLYPDVFAGLLSWVGYGGDGCLRTELHNQCPNGGPANVYEFFENLAQVPAAMLYAGQDELVNVQQSEAVRQRFAEVGVPHIFYVHPVADHFTFLASDDWRKEAAWTAQLSRAPRPVRVRYRTEPWLDAPALGIQHDRAYWVHEIVGHDTGEDEYVDVLLITSACGGSLDGTQVVFPASTGLDPVPWSAQLGSVVGADPLPVENRLEGRLVNVKSLEVNVGLEGGACLGPDPVAYTIEIEALATEGPTTLRLSDGREVRFPGSGAYEGVIAMAAEPVPTLPWPALVVLGGVALVTIRALRSRARVGERPDRTR